MPFVICNQHGGNIAPHACRHGAELIWAGQPVGRLTFVDLDGTFFSGWICDACLSVMNQKGLQTYLTARNSHNDYPSETELSPFLDDIDLQPVCPTCLEAAIGGSAISNTEVTP